MNELALILIAGTALLLVAFLVIEFHALFVRKETKMREMF